MKGLRHNPYTHPRENLRKFTRSKIKRQKKAHVVKRGRNIKALVECKKKTGGDLLSHNLHAVPSTQQSLTAEFGMGSGVASVL